MQVICQKIVLKNNNGKPSKYLTSTTLALHRLYYPYKYFIVRLFSMAIPLTKQTQLQRKNEVIYLRKPNTILFTYFQKVSKKQNKGGPSKFALTFFRMGEEGGDNKPSPLTRFSPVTSTNAGIAHKI